CGPLARGCRIRRRGCLCSLYLVSQRQPDSKPRAAPRRAVFGRDRAAMRLDNSLANGQAQARSTILRLRRTIKLLEHPARILRRKARPAICNADDQIVIDQFLPNTRKAVVDEFLDVAGL